MPLIKTKLGACIIFLLLCATCYQLTAQSQLRYEKLTSDDGLPSYSIRAIMQDSFGFIWIGTDNGLCRYDGNELKTYIPLLHDSTSISGNVVTSLYEDKLGNIWVSTLSNGLNVFDRKTETFRRFTHNPNDSTSISDNSFIGIQLMLEDRDGNFWIGTDNGINLFDRSTNTFRELPIGTELKGNIPTTGRLRVRADERAAKRIRGIYQDSHQNLWVGTDWGGLYRYDYTSKKFVGYFPDPDNVESISYTTPGDFLEDESGNMWILNYWNGLDKLDLKTGKFQQFPNDPYDPHSLSANAPLSRFFIDGNIIWIGAKTGLFTFNTIENKLEQFITNNSDFEGASPFLKDKQGNYWFGNGSGLLIINNIHQGFQKYAHQDDDPKSISSDPYSIGVDSKGVVYITNADGVDILNEKKEKIKFVSAAPKANNPRLAEDLNCILETTSGNLLFVGLKVCQFNTGIQYLEDVYPEAENPTAGYSIDVLEDADNNIWYAGYCLSVYNPLIGNFNYYYPKGYGNFAANKINSLLEAGPSNILIGGVWDGLILFDTKQRKFVKEFPFSNQNILKGSTATVYKIFRSQDQKIWVGSNYGLSLFDMEKETYHAYGIKEGLPSNVVYNILEDSHHNLWLATSKGLSRFDPKTESFRNYDQRDGLAGDEFYFGHAAFKHPTTGELWFLGPKGLTVFNPDSLRDNTYIPPVIFTKCVYYNRKENNGEPITDNTIHNKDLVRFAYSDNIIEFHFAALNFVSPEKNMYAYRLIGFNDEWVNLGQRREVSFTNLNPGKYTLQVKGSNNDGVWNEEGRSIILFITPPWWLTWWAYSLYAIGLILFIWRLHKLQKARTIRIERERTQAKELEQAKEIEKAYSQLEASHENLKATQKQLIQSEKMASLGELTAGIAHEIQNPLNFINNFSELNTELITELREERNRENRDFENEDGLLQNVIENEEKILHHGKRADAIVKGMLQHSRTGNGKKEPTDINALADEYLRLAYHGLRAKDKSFNATMKTDFDETIGMVNVIPQDIGRVILNLITNAFYAVSTPKSPKGELPYEPIVTVKTKLLKPPFLEGHSPQAEDLGDLGAEGAMVEISVRDNGPGIPQSALDKIFQPFFTTKPTGKGTGLGLSMSYDIIKAHGGEIKVDTTEGKGSIFTVILPYKNL